VGPAFYDLALFDDQNLVGSPGQTGMKQGMQESYDKGRFI
jgi:hypothetical protein